MDSTRKLLSSEFFAQLQSAQDLLAERLHICLVLVDADGRETTLPSGLPLICSEHEDPHSRCPACHTDMIGQLSPMQEFVVAACPNGLHLAALTTSIRTEDGPLYLLAGRTKNRTSTEREIGLLQAIFTLPFEALFPSRRPSAVDQSLSAPRSALTSQENRVLAYMVAGLPNKDIAACLCISQSTVKAHVTSILKKLNLSNRTEACVYALKNGIQLGDQIE